jgi:mannose-6-phosphate isomerase-like protein (cupin superfamily)
MDARELLSRRKLVLTLPALAAISAYATEKNVLPSKTYNFNDLKVGSHAGYTGRPVFEGYTHQGFRIAMHESKLDVGAMPHPPHHHKHEEMFMMREGELEVTIAGKTTHAGPGDVVYVASNEEHGVRNIGKVAAQYFVVELGTDS